MHGGYLGAIRQLVGSEIDFPEGSFADQAAERVVADGGELGGGEFC